MLPLIPVLLLLPPLLQPPPLLIPAKLPLVFVQSRLEATETAIQMQLLQVELRFIPVSPKASKQARKKASKQASP